jgi:hypothetical protein
MAALAERLDDLHQLIEIKSVQILNAEQGSPESVIKRGVCDSKFANSEFSFSWF